MVAQPDTSWVLLSYRIPREPSTPRIAVWRQLRDLGVAQIGDGLVGLPMNPRNRERLEWIAAKVFEAKGDAVVWDAKPTMRQSGKTLAVELNEARTSEYQHLVDEIAASQDPTDRTVQKWRRAWRAIDKRDYFDAPMREQARRMLDDIVQSSDTTTVPS